MTTQRFTAILYWEADEEGHGGVYVAESPEVGTASQGDSIEEALANLAEATVLYPKAGGVQWYNDSRATQCEAKASVRDE